jgi:hypothetical protein
LPKSYILAEQRDIERLEATLEPLLADSASELDYEIP